MPIDPEIQEMLDNRSFNYDQVYQADEIMANAFKCDDPEDYDGIIYLVATGNDGREYWFIESGDGWIVDHTWGAFLLSKQSPPPGDDHA
jgi:hypothetical protein